MDSTGESKRVITDSGKFLLKTTKYHDRKLTVGYPSSDNVEEIGVVSVHLISQSTVFRAMFAKEMFEDGLLIDLTDKDICITDVTPKVFKLMLRFVYGGKMPRVSNDTLSDLLLCAKKYKIEPLVKWISARLVPISEDWHMFLVLLKVAYFDDADILPYVLKNKRFFEITEDGLEIIAEQKTLAVTELQLWESLVTWAKGQTEDPTEQRRLLTKPLKHVRFLTLTQEEIVKDVMETDILSPAEIVHILSAITKNKSVTLPGLCSVKEKRGLSTSCCLLSMGEF